MIRRDATQLHQPANRLQPMTPLEPLLCPASIAVLGASQRKGSVGNEVVLNLMNGKYAGQLFPVNPRYELVETHHCYPTLDDLPITVDHVILTVGDENIESALVSAIAHGARACTIFTNLFLDSDEEPGLKTRISNLAKEAGIALLGGNSMGFYNFVNSVWVCGFATRSHSATGNVALISQSGSGMAGILDAEERINFNFAASTGQELILGLEDLLLYAIDLPSTRVVGLFMETCRKPLLLLQALEKAKARRIPIVAIKVGKSELAAELGVSHSGALAGRDDVFEAVFDRYGVQRVADMNQLATALIMFAQPHKVSTGGLATIHDSGGERQLLADLASELNVQLAVLNKHSQSELDKVLEPGMPAVNPLDAWNKGGSDADEIMSRSFSILMSDPDTAFGAVVMDRGPGGLIHQEYRDYLTAAHQASAKPAFLVTNHQGVGNDKLAIDMTRAGFPVLDSLPAFLVGARCLIDYRDYFIVDISMQPRLPEKTTARWNRHFAQKPATSEYIAAKWLSECGIPMSVSYEVTSTTDLQLLSNKLTFPTVLKTAEPGIVHKSAAGGVKLDIETPQALELAFQQLSTQFGPNAIVASMDSEPGLEMILGSIDDSEFGPVVIMGLGGTQTELLSDAVMVLPPFGAGAAKHAISKLRHHDLFDNPSRKAKGLPSYDIDHFCHIAAIFSMIVVEFSDVFSEIEINPIKVLEKGCLGLDALVVMRNVS
ncbi:MAG TPA: CoA-binding protein [Gammaproteobacteria bacterium]|nr:CoA-binding protein [Gammaproteobacteria bacterium]